MISIGDKSVSLISKAAAITEDYFKEALKNVDDSELLELQRDIARLEKQGIWSIRIVEVMKRAKMISDADQMLSRYEAA